MKYNDADKTISTPCHNRIVFGAPGTGKSWKIKEESAIFEDNITRVTFHPEYSYFDFVGSYKPVMREVAVKNDVNGQTQTTNERKIEYDFVPGPFAYILRKALEHPYASHCLIIEEINRARVAAVFGDIFQLLDRNKGGESEYEIMPSLELARYLQNDPALNDDGINPIRIPNNLYIWATMNSADQGVYPLDTAFKRRWSMEYLDINTGEQDDDWNAIRHKINDLLLKKGNVNEDKLMGYYFLKPEERSNAHLEDSLKSKVLMYLFDDAAKPCRKSIFKEINEKRTYSELREALSLEAENLNIFEGGPFHAYNQDDEWDIIRKAINEMIGQEHFKYFYLEKPERNSLAEVLEDKVLNLLWADNVLKDKVFKEELQNLADYNFELADMGVFRQDVRTPVQQQPNG